MTIQKAVEWQIAFKQTYKSTPAGVDDACDMAISALEKQIAKKPVIYKGTNRADCPICGMTVRGIDKPFGDFCSKCGQRLDWSE